MRDIDRHKLVSLFSFPSFSVYFSLLKLGGITKRIRWNDFRSANWFKAIQTHFKAFALCFMILKIESNSGENSFVAKNGIGNITLSSKINVADSYDEIDDSSE